MADGIKAFFSSEPTLLITLADSLFCLTFLAITVTLFSLLKSKRLPFYSFFITIGLFIAVCSLTLVIELGDLWEQYPGLHACIRLTVALVSFGTAAHLFSLKSQFLYLVKAVRASADGQAKIVEQFEALRKSEERFRLVIESVHDYAIFMLDTEGKIATWNQGAKRMKGYDASEIVGRHFSQFYRKEDIDEGKPSHELAEAIRTGRHENEGWTVKADGSRFWANTVITALRDPQGNLVGFAKLTRDLTERKHAEDALKLLNSSLEKKTQQLQKSQMFLDSMLENLPNMVFVKDAEHLRFVRFNKAGEDLIGVGKDLLIGKNDYDLFPKEQADFFTEKDRAVLQGHSIVDIPEEFIGTSRGQRILHTRKIPIFNEEGKAEYLLGISEDITEWKKAQEERLVTIREQAALEERERTAERNAFLAEASTVLASSLDYHENLKQLVKMAVSSLADWCVVTVIKEEVVLEHSAVAHRLPEKVPLVEKLVTTYWKSWLGEIDTDPNRKVSLLEKVIRSGKSHVIFDVKEEELKAVIPDEVRFGLIQELGCASSLIIPIESRGKIHGAVTFISADRSRLYDSEDLALAEELSRRIAIAIDNAFLYEATQRAVRARDEFLSIASHELKTPITSLKLQLQMTRRNTKPELGLAPTPEKLAKVLDVANIQVNRLTSLIDDLLDISRVEAGKLSFQFEEFDLAVLVAEMVERYFDHLTSLGCQIEVKSSPSAKIWADRFRIEQVILNLLSNATKYGEGKPILISVAERGEIVEVSCTDHGMGIPENKLTKVFERFERVNSSRNISGLGLGLYIAREIVKAHKGLIGVESKLGCGSRFIVQLPTLASFQNLPQGGLRGTGPFAQKKTLTERFNDIG